MGAQERVQGDRHEPDAIDRKRWSDAIHRGRLRESEGSDRAGSGRHQKIRPWQLESRFFDGYGLLAVCKALHLRGEHAPVARGFGAPMSCGRERCRTGRATAEALSSAAIRQGLDREGQRIVVRATRASPRYGWPGASPDSRSMLVIGLVFKNAAQGTRAVRANDRAEAKRSSHGVACGIVSECKYRTSAKSWTRT